MSVKGIRINVFIVIMAIIALAAGVYIMIFSTAGFEKTTAEIVSIEEITGADAEDTEYIVTVKYDVDGVTYTEELDTYKSSYGEGQTISVMYDPDDPATVRAGDKGPGIYLIGLGIVLLAGLFLSSRREKKDLEDLRSEHPEGAVYSPSVKGKERHLYFLTDAATAKYGHRIEDENRKVLYEAKVTKFTLSAPIGFDFIDREHRRKTPHLVGHEESTEWDTFLIDNHYTFTFDGEDIWKHLKNNGISVKSGFIVDKMLWPQYRIFRDGEEIALVQSSSVNVHEEDAEAKGKLGNLMPAPGFYRIWTREEYLDLLFVTIMAFARTSANDDSGGNYGLLIDKHKGE